MTEDKMNETQTENQAEGQTAQKGVKPSSTVKTGKPTRKNEHYGVGSTTYEGEEVLGAKPVSFPAGHLSRE